MSHEQPREHTDAGDCLTCFVYPETVQEHTIATLTAQRDQLVKAAVDVYHGFAISSALRTAGMVQLGNLFDAIYAIAPEALREGIERQPNIHDLVAQRDALRTALEFYADPWAWNRAQPDEESRVWIPDLYGELEFGSRAREALGGSREHNKADYDL